MSSGYVYEGPTAFLVLARPHGQDGRPTSAAWLSSEGAGQDDDGKA
jgi:hypothetical protein